jgi:hypothetical protein
MPHRQKESTIFASPGKRANVCESPSAKRTIDSCFGLFWLGSARKRNPTTFTTSRVEGIRRRVSTKGSETWNARQREIPLCIFRDVAREFMELCTPCTNVKRANFYNDRALISRTYIRRCCLIYSSLKK